MVKYHISLNQLKILLKQYDKMIRNEKNKNVA